MTLLSYLPQWWPYGLLVILFVVLIWSSFRQKSIYSKHINDVTKLNNRNSETNLEILEQNRRALLVLEEIKELLKVRALNK